jgi:porin
MISCLLLLILMSSPAAAEEAPEDLYAGDFLSRSTLTGNWNGGRDSLAAKGVSVDARLTQIGQGVVDGGTGHSWEYSGRFNLTERFDTQKMGLWPGGFFTLQLDGNWGDAVNANSGALMPANSQQLYPWPTGDNFNVSELSYAQFLSHYFGVQIGKLETVSNGDSNEFAHGRGDTQFLNLALNLNPLLAVTAPYSTLGAAAIILPTEDPNEAIVTLSVIQANGSARDIGFDELSEDKLTFGGQGRMRTNFFHLTGHQLVGGLYSNKTFTSLDQRLGFVIQNRDLSSEDNSWAVYYNFDQFLYELDEQAGRGAGIFGRFGASDGNPNLMQYFVSVGVGGTGMLHSRPYDRFGIGYYWINIESPTFQRPLATRSFLEDEHGLEVFYNIAITPWMLLTPDIQVLWGAQKERLGSGNNVDTAIVLGLRFQLIL